MEMLCSGNFLKSMKGILMRTPSDGSDGVSLCLFLLPGKASSNMTRLHSTELFATVHPGKFSK